MGYDVDEDGNLVINKEEAETVRLCYYLFLNGFPTAEIAEILMQLKRKTKLGNTKWSSGTVGSLLRNERYCGDVLSRKTFTPNYLDHKSKRIVMIGTSTDKQITMRLLLTGIFIMRHRRC